jgi:hypothetical protein
MYNKKQYIKIFRTENGYKIQYPNGYELEVSEEELEILERGWSE